MPDQTPKVLSHFSFFRFRETYYHLTSGERQQLLQSFITKLRNCAQSTTIYQVYPTNMSADILVWSANEVEDAGLARRFFLEFARATNPFRDLIKPIHTLWGFTKPSQYTKARSTQEIDPFDEHRKPYLVIYPFTKTGDWYLMSREARQGMMNEHIKIGKQHPEITQLLLYSFGLQDQEFVVVYETDDLTQFSDLVYALRNTEARRFTLGDTPLYTAVYHPGDEALALWGESRVGQAE